MRLPTWTVCPVHLRTLVRRNEMSTVSPSNLSLDLVVNGSCLSAHARASGCPVSKIGGADLKGDRVVWFGNGFGSHDDLPALGRRRAELQFGGQRLVLSSHDTTNLWLDRPDLFRTVHVFIEDLELYFLLLFKWVVHCKEGGEVWV